MNETRNLRITSMNPNNPDEKLDIQLSGAANTDVDLIIEAIHKLIHSIDVKHASSEDYHDFQLYMKQILFSVAENLSIEGWSEMLTEDDRIYNEETDSDSITNIGKIKILEAFLQQYKR
ncbi:hypothetical protein [Alkalihalobacillus sp. TS-13]|uniref:hypothetical protein n=1 Tax=Alkalihalobacillus sp. TS-13 TaxID=2842455 RepID=UPI001C868868|nr:hypothetical protein [Alkalihalobacillus sp. TS-13]